MLNALRDKLMRRDQIIESLNVAYETLSDGMKALVVRKEIDPRRGEISIETNLPVYNITRVRCQRRFTSSRSCPKR